MNQIIKVPDTDLAEKIRHSIKLRAFYWCGKKTVHQLTLLTGVKFAGTGAFLLHGGSPLTRRPAVRVSSLRQWVEAFARIEKAGREEAERDWWN
jgi:hypothetical protein